MSSIAAPIGNTQREIFLDVLRGFAILGIFIANLNAFTWYGFEGKDSNDYLLSAKWDHRFLFLHHMLIEGKFYSIFSMLFGWGIALQINRLANRGVSSVSFIRRRLLVMLALGALHLLLWPGDIVFLYALIGFILLPFRKLSDKTLLFLSAFFFLLPIGLYALKMHFPVCRIPSNFMFEIGGKLDEKLIGVTSEETFVSYIKNANWYELLLGDISGFFYRYGDLFFQSRFSKVLSMMLLGFVIGRSGFYTNIHRYKNVLYALILFGVIIALPANYLLAGFMERKDGSYQKFSMAGLQRTISYAIGVVPLALAYVALFMLAFQHSGIKKVLSKLAPVGKMAFSNYMFQTLIGNFVFLPAGLGYMGKIGPAYYTLFALIVFLFQILLSTVWLRYFLYGPIEWLWRSGTYGKWQPMKRKSQN